jgi:hypothetical protein
MLTPQPSSEMLSSLLHADTRHVVSLSMAALISGALSQVESIIELTNRVCDSVLERSPRSTPFGNNSPALRQ